MKLSVIIPAYNEEANIAQTIQAVLCYGEETVNEIIVVDGGSSDATISVASEAGAKTFQSPRKGRAAQMNYGAKQAVGDILFFLHADSQPPANFAHNIIESVSKGFKAGCFQLAFDQNHLLLDLYAWCTRFDVDAFRFGDQGLFITRDLFYAIKGFREDHVVMEDNEIVRRIKEKHDFIILKDAVVTSARSYRKAGIVKMQLVFVFIYTLYFFGVDQQTLAHIKQAAQR